MAGALPTLLHSTAAVIGAAQRRRSAALTIGLYVWLLIVLLLAAARSPAANRESALPDDAAAVVNGVPIPERIVHAFLQNGQEALRIDPATEVGRNQLAKLRDSIIDEQIERTLIAAETERRGIAPTREQLEEAERRRILGLGGEERYEEFLRQNHLSREDHIQYVIRSALCGEAVKNAFASEIAISDEAVETYYEAHKDEPELQWPERVTVAHILLNGRRGMIAEQLKLEKRMADGPQLEKAIDEEIARRAKLAEEIRARAAEPGGDFAALAAKYSEDFGSRNKGGSLGTSARGMRPIAFDEVAFSLKPGEVGPVVKTEYGYHVIKTMERKPAGPRTLGEAAPQIRGRLLAAEQARRMREWLAIARREARITIRSGVATAAE